MRAFGGRPRPIWGRSDTLLLATNLAAFALFVGNTAWHSVAAAYAGVLFALGLQAAGALRRSGGLRDAVMFGALLAALWVVGDAATLHLAGAWGTYHLPGPRLWETPPLALLVGWMSATHLHYWTRRLMDWGAGGWAAAAFAGASALALGVLGESLFVEAGLWSYAEAAWVWWHVPAFVPVSYGLAFATLPRLFRLPLIWRALAAALLVFAVSVGLGYATGFFTR